MNRSQIFSRLQDHSHREWDMIIVGGGATGAGIALDAASRGYDTLLLEQEDFGKGTSSRSTKLLHGGVRYLANGDLNLVLEALRERGLILKNAPHVTFNQKFVVPVYSIWEAIKYTLGLKFYDLLAGRLSLGSSRFVNRKTTLSMMGNLNPSGLMGGVIYHDGQFDDARLLISLIRTINENGGTCINYFRVTGLLKNEIHRICGVRARDGFSGTEFDFHGRVVINATGVFADEILKMDQPVIKRTIRPSQGIHLVLDRKFLRGDSAIMIPKTEDGRVLFAIPWYDRIVIGTTDTPVDSIALEPKALQQEIDFILNTCKRYLTHPPQLQDILTVFAGLRPLVASADNPSATHEISRRHKITISSSGLVTVEGGKWTTYRRMAEDTINRVIKKGMIESRKCMTRHLQVTGSSVSPVSDRLNIYGLHAGEIRALANGAELLHPSLPYTKAEIIWICRNEMPGKLEDVLARRTRALFLNARASQVLAPRVAAIMAQEMGFDKDWEKSQVEEYNELVKKYIID